MVQCYSRKKKNGGRYTTCNSNTKKTLKRKPRRMKIKSINKKPVKKVVKKSRRKLKSINGKPIKIKKVIKKSRMKIKRIRRTATY